MLFYIMHQAPNLGVDHFHCHLLWGGGGGGGGGGWGGGGGGGGESDHDLLKMAFENESPGQNELVP